MLTPSEGAEPHRETLGGLARGYLLSPKPSSTASPAMWMPGAARCCTITSRSTSPTKAATRASVERLQAAMPPCNHAARHYDRSGEGRIAIERMRHGNLKLGWIEEDLILSGDYKTIRTAAQSLDGWSAKGATIRRGDKAPR